MPGSLLRSLPESVRTELGLGVRPNGGSAAVSPGTNKTVPQKRDSDAFLSTQPEDLELSTQHEEQELSGESDEIEKTLIQTDDVELMVTEVDEEVPEKVQSTSAAVLVASDEVVDDSPIARKRRKLDDDTPYDGPLSREFRQYDASALVPHYQSKEDMPPSLQKCQSCSNESASAA